MASNKHGYNLLTENSTQVELLESVDANGKQQTYIEGIFAQAEKVNGNDRMYRRSIMDSALNSYINSYVSQNKALGELNHPDYPIPDPAYAAILIKEMKWDGNDVYGKALVMNTPRGNIVKSLMESGFNMGVSTRGLGSLKEERGVYQVQDDFIMTAVDCVNNPSGPDCYVKAVTESTKWVMNEQNVWVPQIDESLSDENNLDMFFDKFQSLLKNLKTMKR